MSAADFEWRWRARLAPHADVDDPLGVHDGDTLTLELDRGLDGTRTLATLRLGGPTAGSDLWVDAPELEQPGGHDARLEVVRWLLAHHTDERWPYRVQTWRTRTDRSSKATLARYIAHVTTPDGASLNREIRAWLATTSYPHGIGGRP